MFRSQQPLHQTDIPGPHSRRRQPALGKPNTLWSRMALSESGIQPRLKVGPVNDPYEKEADTVANRVMRMPDGKFNQHDSNPASAVTTLQRQPTPLEEDVQRQEVEEEEEEMLQTKRSGSDALLQRKCQECEEEVQRQPLEEEEEVLQPRRNFAQSEVAAQPSLDTYVSGIKGGGQPLSDADRQFFEPRFGHDFSNVRLHSDQKADEAANAINAEAFTTGNNIVLSRQSVPDGSWSNRHLLAHELTHVVQQRGDAGGLQTKPAPVIQRKSHPCEPKIGTCEFYECLSDMTPGDRASGYYWNYGRKYCLRFNSSSLMDDPKAARWLDCVTISLHRALLKSCVKHGNDLEKVKQCGYGTHAKVYTDCGICELDKTFVDQFKVLFTPDAGDLWTSEGLKQVLESLTRCFLRPFVFQMIIDRFTSWGNLDEEALGQEIARWSRGNPVANYPLILGVIELLSNTMDDDDVAYECMRDLSDSDLDRLESTADGRRVLFVFKHALSGGVIYDEEQAQIDRIGNRSRR